MDRNIASEQSSEQSEETRNSTLAPMPFTSGRSRKRAFAARQAQEHALHVAATLSRIPLVERHTRTFMRLERVEPRFPKPRHPKEFAQATGRAETRGLTDRQAIVETLKHGIRYLARRLCYVMTIRAWRPTSCSRAILWTWICSWKQFDRGPGSIDLDTVVGLHGPIAPPDMCNGLMGTDCCL